MKHIAIMRKSWGLLGKILTGKKKIESRWYKNKCRPWDKIKKGDTIYFKDSGEPASLKAKVEKIFQFENLTPEKVKNILNKYAKDDGIEKERIPEFFRRFENKKYCLLIFLKNPQKIRPFEINKTGFGTMSAWLIVENINQVLKKNEN